MTADGFARFTPAMRPSVLRRAIATLPGLPRWPFKAALLLGAAAFLMHALPWSVEIWAAFASGNFAPLWQLASDEFAAATLVLAVVLAERVTDNGVNRKTPYVLAVLLAVCAWALVDTATRSWFDIELGWPAGPADPEVRWSLYFGIFEWTMLGGAAAAIYVGAKRARIEAGRRQEAEVQRAHTAKRLVESRLQALQARVEPQFLFNTLAQVRRLYEVDATLAGRMLDDLIAYLRAAMPLMRDSASTVGRELELARAYLEIVKVRLGERLAVEIETEDALDDARMPPMMLLPLIDHAVVRCLGLARTSGSIRIGCSVVGGKLRLAIADSGAGFVPEDVADGIGGIRERLAALYGDAARLELRRRDAGATEAVMEIPYETMRKVIG